MSKYKYGWIPSSPHTAKKYSLYHTALPTLPLNVDLRSNDVPIFDQLTLGSCTANGVADLIEYVQRDITVSRLYQYYYTRYIEGTVDQDAGGQIHDAIKAAVIYGIVPESLWPYIISKFALQPPQSCSDASKKDLVIDYFNLETTEDIKQCLSAGFPVVFGITLYDSFEGEAVATTGIVPEPDTYVENIIGGHCMVVIGYDDRDPNNKTYIIRNSWNTSWGQKGYCIMPQDMFETYASDFWTVRKTTGI